MACLILVTFTLNSTYIMLLASSHVCCMILVSIVWHDPAIHDYQVSLRDRYYPESHIVPRVVRGANIYKTHIDYRLPRLEGCLSVIFRKTWSYSAHDLTTASRMVSAQRSQQTWRDQRSSSAPLTCRPIEVRTSSSRSRRVRKMARSSLRELL